MVGDGGGRWGTTQCRPSWSLALTCGASSGKDGTGRRNVVRPRPGPGRTDCPVANTGCGLTAMGFENKKQMSHRVWLGKHLDYWNCKIFLGFCGQSWLGIW